MSPSTTTTATTAPDPPNKQHQGQQQETVVVIGGAGFLGKHVVAQLLEHPRFSKHVRVFDLRDAHIPAVERATTGDLRRLEDVVAAVAGADVVIHVASVTPSSAAARARELMHGVNVVGTRNVIEACRRCGVRRLVFTSSVAVAPASKLTAGADEAAAGYVARPPDHYAATKLEAERAVLAANDDAPELATCALRPNAMFGDGDPLVVPGLVRLARAGRMKYLVGGSGNLWDWTYVGNVARAHVLAAERLEVGSPVAGEAFFITNGEPVPFGQLVGDVLEGLGYERPTKRVPLWAALAGVAAYQYVVYPVLAPLTSCFCGGGGADGGGGGGDGGGLPSDLSVAHVRRVAGPCYYSGDKARRLLGYEPTVSVSEGVARAVAAFPHLRKKAAAAAGFEG